MRIIVNTSVLIVVLLCLGACSTGRSYTKASGIDEKASKFGKPYYFIQMADPQLGFTNKGTSWEYEVNNFRMAIEHANRLKPDFVMICGDLINNPDVKSQIFDFLKMMELFSGDFPVYLIAGNHDINPGLGPEDIKIYKDWFYDDYYAFTHKDCRFIIIDTTLIRQPDNCREYVREMREWLEKELKSAKENGYTQTFVVGHHPWFLKKVNEEDQYFNMPQPTRSEYLELFKQYGVEYIFAGHYHRNCVAVDDGLEMITSGPVGPSLGEDPSGIRIVKVNRNNIEHTYYGLEDVPDSLDKVEF
jgi:3',5'-cyclic AMP phosphodiesterase CpdA